MRLQKVNMVLSFLSFVLVSSCATLKKPKDFNSIVEEKNLTVLEGTYRNLDVNSNTRFWERFCSVDIIKHKEVINDSTSVFKVRFESDNKITFELYSADKLELSETLKYKYHQSGLAIKGRSNYRYQGVPLIFYRYASQALWLSKDNEEELYLSFNGSASGGIFVLIFGSPIKGEARFKKVSE